MLPLAVANDRGEAIDSSLGLWRMEWHVCSDEVRSGIGRCSFTWPSMICSSLSFMFAPMCLINAEYSRCPSMDALGLGEPRLDWPPGVPFSSIIDSGFLSPVFLGVTVFATVESAQLVTRERDVRLSELWALRMVGGRAGLAIFSGPGLP